MDYHLQCEEAVGYTEDGAAMVVMMRALFGAHRGSHRWQSTEGFGNGLYL